MHQQMSFCYRSFYETWRVLDAKITPDTINEFTIPWIVNGAFACEVGMKCILQQNKIEFDKVHLLHELFNLLPDKHKAEIEKELCEKYPSYTMEQLNQEVLLLSNSFCNFRYFYEKTLTINLFLFRAWCMAIYKQVDNYPSYTLVESLDTDSITVEQFDAKALCANNEMLSGLKKKRTKGGGR